MIRIPVLFAACLLLPAAVLAQAEDAPAAPVTIPSPVSVPPALEGDAQRQILVTFTDRSLTRPPHGTPGPQVNRGTEYGTTTWSRRVSEGLATDHHLRRVQEWPILSLGVHCVVYVVEDARSLADVMTELKQDGRVESVQPMGTFRVLGGDPYAPLQTTIRGMNIEQAHRWATGRGVTIAIVDTGVDLDHPDLHGQFASYADLAGTNTHMVFDEDIHGTAVAGVIAALAGNGQGIVGVAPQARLMALRACWPTRVDEPGAQCNSLSIATALDAAIRAEPQIINLSLTGPADPLVAALLAAALAKNIVVVVAEPPAADDAPHFVDGMSRIIRVRRSGDGVSSREPAGVVSAPGQDVLTTFPHGTYNYISGSSFAAASVSGIIALMLELRPHLSIAEIHSALMSGLIPSSDAKNGDGIDACRVLDSLGVGAGCPL